MDTGVHNVDMESKPGAQVVSRVAACLRAVSATGRDGATTTGVARSTGLARTTVHRLLDSLAAEGLVDHDHRLGRWFPGPELYLLGGVAAERYDVTHEARESVRALAAATGESAFFSARRGAETVCLLEVEGSFPVRSHVLHEGVRFPLGVASAGLVLLSFLDDDEIERHLARTRLEERFGAAYADGPIHERVAATRAAGYATNPALIVEGSWGMGAAIFDEEGRPAWALSLTGIEPRFSAARRPELGRLLLEHAHRVTKRIAERRR